MWESYKKGYKAYLQLEKSLAGNSITAYLHDVDMFTAYLQSSGHLLQPREVTLKELQQFLKWVTDLGLSAGSQARVISGLRSFYKYCFLEQISSINPTELLELPKLKRSLPEVLTFDEIEKMINKIDLTTPEGNRNKAILETMYSCGLRVTELVNLKLSCLYLDRVCLTCSAYNVPSRMPDA